MTSQWSRELGDFQRHSEFPAASVVQVGVCKIEIFFPFSHSLKEKNQKIFDVQRKLRDQFSVEVSEIGFQDKWQRSGLAFSVLSEDRAWVQERLDKVVAAIEDLELGEILDLQMEILSL